MIINLKKDYIAYSFLGESYAHWNANNVDNTVVSQAKTHLLLFNVVFPKSALPLHPDFMAAPLMCPESVF